MSTAAAQPSLTTLQASDAAPRSGRRLRALDAPVPRRRPKLVYGIVAVLCALAIGGAQMALSVLTTQGSYELSALTTQQRELTWQKQILYDEVAGLSSPQYLAANATALGMVIEQSPSYLRLSDGVILGPSEIAMGGSSIDALDRAAVPNALITDVPLVSDPDATIDGAPVATAVDGAVVDTPPAVVDGLPTPTTH